MHDWRRIKTLDEAMRIAQEARNNKDLRAVHFGKQRAQKTENRSRIPGPKPVPETRTENSPIPGPGFQDYGGVRKPGPLSISRAGGERAGRGVRAKHLPQQSDPWLPSAARESRGEPEGGGA
jgi:hypothetical protein